MKNPYVATWLKFVKCLKAKLYYFFIEIHWILSQNCDHRKVSIIKSHSHNLMTGSTCWCSFVCSLHELHIYKSINNYKLAVSAYVRFIERNCIIIQRLAIKETRRSFLMTIAGEVNTTNARKVFVSTLNYRINALCMILLYWWL